MYKCLDTKAIIVLGMHRSGTSLLTGILHQSGIYLGEELFPAQKDNPRGCWENKKVIKLNDEILSTFDLTYQSPQSLPDEWWNSDKMKLYKELIRDLIEKEFSGHHFIGIKDPRMCRLLPLWNLIFEELNINPVYILIYRNPFEVANSLFKRDNIYLQKGIFLWLRYNLEAEKLTRNQLRSFLSYTSILNNWKECFKSIDRNLHLKLLSSLLDRENKINEFIIPELRHHQYSDEEIPLDIQTNKHKLVKTLYQCFKKAEKDNSKAMSYELDEISEILSALDGFVWDILEDEINSRFYPLHQELEQLIKINQEMQSSLSWRVTAPLRLFKKVISPSSEKGKS